MATSSSSFLFVGHFIHSMCGCKMAAAKLLKCCVKSTSTDANLTFSEEDDDSDEPVALKTYHRYWIRWVMLLALFILNISNGTMWLTYAPIPDKTMTFYGITSLQLDFFSISFFITSLIVGFFSMYVLDTYGLGPGVMTGALLNGLGALVRLISALPAVNHNHMLYYQAGYAVAMSGQILCAAAQPFTLYAPTKFAMLWFGDKERAIPTALASMANPLGIAVAFLVSPNVARKPEDVFTLSWIYLIPAGVGGILTVLTFWRNRPPTPPSLAAEHKQDSFFKGLKLVFCQWQFIVLLLVWGAGAGLMNSLLSLVPQFLCPFGYDDNFSGLWVAMMIICGLVGAFLAGIVIDYTKRYEEVAKLALAMATLTLVWFLQVFNRENQYVNVAVCLCVFGFFAFILMPTCLELGVEITYPVAESTSAGLLWSVAQVFGAVLTFVGPLLGRGLSEHQRVIQKCSKSSDSEATDMTYAIIFYASVAALAFIFLVIFFHPKYKRTIEEKIEKQKRFPSVPSSVVPDTQELIT